MKKIVALFFVVFSWSCYGQKPKLVVGIIVDQMRQEYLLRFEHRFAEGGFKCLMNDGYMFKNAHFNYIPTYTAPGHTSVYTGTTPAAHGIIGNGWYDHLDKDWIYCAEDSTVNTVGSESTSGQMSPKNLLVTTITDELRFSSQMSSKVVGLSIKDRGAIFPAGHTGQAYWYDKENGNFITSTYYRKDLPDWLKDFNNARHADRYLKQTWDTKFDIETYAASSQDDTPYEGKLLDKVTFPYNLKKLTGNKYEYLPGTPFGSDILTDIALAALDGEDLGNGTHTDFLAISFSSTDYIGHQFGPNSVEIEDTYVRLDVNIKTILDKLDQVIGKGEYLVFLTADHAVAEVPQYMIDSNAPGGYFEVDIETELNEELAKEFGVDNLVENVSNLQVFLNRDLVRSKRLDLHKLQDSVVEYLMTKPGMTVAYPAYVVSSASYEKSRLIGPLIKGYNQARSGDVLFSLQSGWLISDRKTGTSHGTGFTYDTHVPMLWYGTGIKSGASVRYHPITDIAPTLSMLLDIKLPSGASGQPLVELFE
ncbi:MAG: alkaline phosphatase PafA [Fulvivirga sp.]